MRVPKHERIDLRRVARIAQLVEHLICNQEVVGSSPTLSFGISFLVKPVGLVGCAHIKRLGAIPETLVSPFLGKQ